MTENPKQACGSTKPQLHLIPPVAEIAEANVLEYGAFKAPRTDGTKGYGPWNWRDDPIKVCTYISAVRRHLNAIMRGEDIDPTSGESHWAHIRANCGIVMDAMDCGSFIDDRPKVREVHQTTQTNPGDTLYDKFVSQQLAEMKSAVFASTEQDPDDLAPITSRMPVRDEEDETPTEVSIEPPNLVGEWTCPRCKQAWITTVDEICPRCDFKSLLPNGHETSRPASTLCPHCHTTTHSPAAPCPLKLKEQLQILAHRESTR